MKHLLYTAIIALLAALSLQGASAQSPLVVQINQEVLLQLAYDDCVAAAANWGKGVLSVHRADWPKGYRDCAIIMREEDRLGRAADRKAWEHWYAKHALQRIQIRQAATPLYGYTSNAATPP